MSKVALITGITGQDGAYLAKLLLEKGYAVHGACRRSSSLNLWRLEALGIQDQVNYVPLELTEFTNILRVIEKVKPDEIYNLAAQSFVHVAFELPHYTSMVSGMAVLNFLEIIREVNPWIRFYQASTSEMFGQVVEIPQTENTPFYPRSPYAVAKLFAHWMVVNYREAYNLHASSGILFNHESPLRGMEFVTRKITAGLARIRHGQQDLLELGNLDALRDWGFAGDYVEGMWRMLQQEKPQDYILAMGSNNSVREFVEIAGQAVGFDLIWEGSGAETLGRDRKSGRVLVRVNPEFYRPAEVEQLCGNPARAKADMGWQPKVDLKGLVEMMVHADMDRAARGRIQF
ncbi:MAG: GDP-mannose 4,6-dehydratase [Magnetococcales bacterium]|nr:GDP-mannose 4,6-dehydratase [Magnetococcales bacterium]MBF0321935.1 GDP-mannose 4,6-dehydratase [Magnetococcales bacterium]